MSEQTQDTAVAAQAEPVKISIAEILKMLEAGKERKEIYKHFGLTVTQGNLLFKHPKLLGKKVHKANKATFDLIDDAPDAKETVSKPRKPRTVNADVAEDSNEVAAAPVATAETASEANSGW